MKIYISIDIEGCAGITHAGARTIKIEATDYVDELRILNDVT